MNKDPNIENLEPFKKGQSGIYKLSFVGSEKFYIGSAVALNKRKANHLSDLRNKKHCNIILQRMYNKYGDFVFNVLEYCDPNKLVETEQYYIDLLEPQINILKVANNSLGYKHSSEVIDKLIVINKINANKKEVRQKTSKSWFRKGHTQKFTKEQIQKRINSFKGYKHKEESKIKMSIAAKNRDRSTYDLSKFINSGIEASKKKVAQYSMQGDLINVFDSITEAVKQFNTTQTRHLVLCCKGLKEKYKGYKWRFTTN